NKVAREICVQSGAPNVYGDGRRQAFPSVGAARRGPRHESCVPIWPNHVVRPSWGRGHRGGNRAVMAEKPASRQQRTAAGLWNAESRARHWVRLVGRTRVYSFEVLWIAER